MMLWALIVDIYEQPSYPIVQHTFYGKTPEEAEGYFQAHMKTDEFLRGCVTRGRWQRVECSHKMRWEQVTPV